ncbi:MAG: PEGA domain-containing protein, partial [Desulfobacterales bacterium]|jgi:formylglycine-generating enzyme required for sulfatase activity
VWFVFTARQLRLEIQPEPEKVTVRGALLTPRILDYYLLRPGTYQLTALKEGYVPLETTITVAQQDRQTLNLTMQKLPGRLDISTHVADQPEAPVTNAQILINEQAVGESPLQALEVAAGSHTLRIETPLYRTLETTITVEGLGRKQTLAFGLTPDFAEVTVDSAPREAEISLDGTRRGVTPATLPMGAGARRLELRRAGFKPWVRTVQIKAGPPVTLETAMLVPLDGRLAITSQPAGANVMVAAQYQGQTPLEIELPPDRPLVVQLSKPGYVSASREVTLTSGEQTAIQVPLTPRRGIVYLRGAPDGATLYVDGQARGPVPEKLTLLAVPHRIEIRKQGHVPQTRQVTPRPGFPIELRVALKRTNATETPGVIKAANGYRLKRIDPGQFQMGASRREQGRRANETLRVIRLTRPVYMGLKEVTNREFRGFEPGHDSGTFKGYDLNQDDRPVVQVTWQQAARFCNWLSRKEGFAPVYVEGAGGLRATNPIGNGYRLPTEAEWEYCARTGPSARSWKYPWGQGYPPPAQSVNIADASATKILNLVLENYADSHPAAAPVGAFPPNPEGLFDLGGNVAEWCHDHYTIYPYRPGQVDTDPVGPAVGQHHVIKGSSWKHASIRNLRAAFRDYQDEARIDLGFRVCRYVGPKETAP